MEFILKHSINCFDKSTFCKSCSLYKIVIKNKKNDTFLKKTFKLIEKKNTTTCWIIKKEKKNITMRESEDQYS